MNQHPVDHLLEREKDVLRLLLQGYDTKACARALGLSTNVVNERLREARRKLGATSSREAARQLAQYEAQDHKFLGPNFSGIVDTPSPRSNLSPPDHQVNGRPARMSAQVREYQTSYIAGPGREGTFAYLPLRKPGELTNALSQKDRLVVIADLTVKLAAMVALVCFLAMIVDQVLQPVR